jgi:hypothetical protein
MDIRKVLVLGGVMAAAFAVPTTAASASVALFPSPPGPHFGSPANVFTATTSITNHPDGGGSGQPWAIDTFTRTLTIKETGHTGSGSSRVYNYTATVSDTGTFKTISGALTPNQGTPYTGKTIKGVVQGTMTGGASYSFTATSLPTRGRNLGVPTHESGNPTSGSPQSTSFWFEQAFPATSITFHGGIGTYSWTYRTGSGGCTQDNGKGNGNGRGKGQGNGNGFGQGNGFGNGNGQGQGNGFGNRGQGNNPGCSCGDDHGRSRGNGQQKGCTQGHDNQGQGNNNGRGGNNNGRGGKGGSQGGGPSKSSAEKWVDSSGNGDGQQKDDGNITGS